MPEASWLLFVLASLVVIATAGQDMILVMSRSVARGPSAGVATAAGVSAGLVAYDNMGFPLGSARLWWALSYYGHDRVRVLDGGLRE